MPVIIPRTQLIRYPKHTHFCCFCLYTQTLIISTTKVSQLSFLLTLAPTLRDNYPLKDTYLDCLNAEYSMCGMCGGVWSTCLAAFFLVIHIILINSHPAISSYLKILIQLL